MRFLFLVFALLLLLPLCILSQPHLDTANSYLYVREATGKNDGVDVDKFLHSVGRKSGDSWCAAFVSYCLTEANVKTPKIRSGLARSFKIKGYIDAIKVLQKRIIVKKGSIIGWQNGLKITGHLGFVTEDWFGVSGKTIEGNTSSGVGSKDNGDGVYIRRRIIQPANYFRITWFLPVGY